MNISRVRVKLNQKILILKTVSVLQKNQCPLFESYSGTSRFIEPKAEERFRWASTSVSKPISFLQEFCIRKWFIGAKNPRMFVWL